MSSMWATLLFEIFGDDRVKYQGIDQISFTYAIKNIELNYGDQIPVFD